MQCPELEPLQFSFWCDGEGLSFEIADVTLRRMTAAVCLLVGMDLSACTIARAALDHVFPNLKHYIFNTFKEVLNAEESPGVQLLVLGNADSALINVAAEAIDEAGLPKWGVIVLGAASPRGDVEAVSTDDWHKPTLEHVFRLVAKQHQLRRENARLRGDLATIAYRINHDIRTPVGGILNATELLKEVLAEHDASAGTLAQPVFDSADELVKLMSRVSAMLKATLKPVTMGPVVMEDVIWAATQRVESKRIKVGGSVEHVEAWPAVKGVADWIEIILGNFLNNALEYGGSSPQIKIGWERLSGEVRFWVHDNGPGVPVDKQHRLFLPFNRLHDSDGGRGLGLSIVQRLVELQNGKYGYEVAPSGGARFHFTLPSID